MPQNPAQPMNGLLNALQERQQTMRGLQTPSMPPPPAKVPPPATMDPAMRALFAQQTGVPANPNARDIPLEPEMSLDELLKRAAAIPGMR